MAVKHNHLPTCSDIFILLTDFSHKTLSPATLSLIFISRDVDLFRNHYEHSFPKKIQLISPNLAASTTMISRQPGILKIKSGNWYSNSGDQDLY